jgi:hypothetical protein
MALNRALLATLIASLLAVTACRDGQPSSDDSAAAATTSVALATTSSADPEPTTSTTAVSTTLPPTTSSTTDATTTTIALPPFPPERESLTHGGDTWVVVLGASEQSDDPILDDAEARAAEAGYTTGATDCDFGAATALGLSEDTHYYTVSVYLSTEADAEAALDAFEARGVKGAVGLVQTFCMD